MVVKVLKKRRKYTKAHAPRDRGDMGLGNMVGTMLSGLWGIFKVMPLPNNQGFYAGLQALMR